MEQSYQLYSSVPMIEIGKRWAEIDLSALRFNYRSIRSFLANANDPPPRIIAVVKAEAYGHGTPACVRALLQEGCDYFAVSCIEEAVAVRRVCEEAGCEAEVLVLGYTHPELTEYLISNRITQTVFSEEYGMALNRAAEAIGKRLSVHVALDTGMNRIGFAAQSEDDAKKSIASIDRLCELSCLSVEGLFTHFARAAEPPLSEGDRRTDEQARRYRFVVDALLERGRRFPLHHACNSAALCHRPREHFDGVRAGILLYGVCPIPDGTIPLRPVMSLKTVIVQIHKLLAREEVGYGGAYKADRERLIATIPVGYADGFIRAYSGARVRVATKSGVHSVEIVGRICMDQCMLDVTDTDAAEGDVVTLFGDSPESLSALAERAGTIEYEALCSLSPRITRVYLNQ